MTDDTGSGRQNKAVNYGLDCGTGRFNSVNSTARIVLQRAGEPPFSPSDPNELTVLETCNDLILTKRINANGSETPYGKETFFKALSVDVGTDEKLDQRLEALARQPKTSVVPGHIAPTANPERMLRRKLDHPGHDDVPFEPATLLDAPRDVFCIDFDETTPPPPAPWIDMRNKVAVAEYVRRRLGTVWGSFGQATCAAVMTTGQARKPGVRVRIFFRLSRPLIIAQFRAWLVELAGPWVAKNGQHLRVRSRLPLDPYPVEPQGLNYVATAIFENPADDPFPEGRLVRLPGEPFVIPPDDAYLDALIERCKGPKRRTKGKPRSAKQPRAKSAKQPRQERDEAPDQQFADLLDDKEAVEKATDYLINRAPVALKGSMHDTGCQVAQRCGDFGCRFEKTIELMLVHWCPRGDLWQTGELKDRLWGLFDARQNALGCDHARAEELEAEQRRHT